MSDTPPILGKYQLLKPLARGRAGEVWKARSHGVEGFEKLVVIKRLSTALSRHHAFVARFIEEAKIAVTLTHANIAQVFDLGLEEETYFVAMEYVRGPSLASVLSFCARAGGGIAAPLAIHIVSELAKGLDYAHRKRDAELRPLSVVHAHVVPQNVLLSYEGDVKLTDFGMARARAAVWSSDDDPGRVPYLAPEQSRGESIDARADVSALGAILRVLLAVDPTGAGATPALATLIAQATASRREARIASAGVLYEQLIALLYESGRRIGPLDLARWLEELAADAISRDAALGPVSALETLFFDRPGSNPPPPLASLGLEASIATPRAFVRPTPRPPSPARTGHIEGPRAEWRDVSVLLVEDAYGPELSACVARFGGQPLEGGEPLFVFGLGEVDGRDAHAAARCALRLLRGRGGERVRAVVHAGRLLLEEGGARGAMEGRDALKVVAQRALRRGRRGEVLATAQTAPLLQQRFEVTPERAPGAPRRVTRELAAHEGLGKFVGRRDELRAIGEVFARANRGTLSVLGVVGDAGTGKSRLVLEMERRLHQAGHDVAFYTAACAPQGRATPWFALQELLRAVLGIDEVDPPGRVREQVDRLRLLGLSGEQRAAVARLLGLPAPRPSSDARVLGSALTRIAYKLAADRLTVFVWDGTDHMDEASRGLLHALLSVARRARVLVVLTYRAPASDAKRAWRRVPGFGEVRLTGLASEDIARLVRNRLGANEVQADLIEAVQQKTGGNPLFVEELLSALREHVAVSSERGVAQLVNAKALALPRTLRGLVAARAANLSVSERLLLQLAAALGGRITAPLLARAAGFDVASVDAALTALVARDVLRLSSDGHVFAHDLLQEVLYEAIPEDARAALHAALARALADAPHPEVVASARLLEQRARHLQLSGQREEAIQCLTGAAERHQAEHALEAAIEAYSQVLALLVDLDSTGATERGRLLALHAHIGELAYHTEGAEQVAERLGDALELAETWGREGYVARFAMLRGRLLNRASRFKEGRLWLSRALEMAQKLDDRLLARDVALALAEAAVRNGEHTSAVPHAAEALAAARATGDRGVEAQALLVTATASAALGQLKRAREAQAQLHALGDDLCDRPMRVEREHVRARVLDAAGERGAALEAARLALELAKTYELTYEIALHAHFLGGLHLRAGDEQRAFAALRLSNEVATAHGYARLRFRNVFYLGFLDAMRFDAEASDARMLQAFAHAEERGHVADLIDEQYLLALVAQKRGEPERARTLLRAVLELADTHGHVRTHDDAEQALRAIEEARPIALPR
ncbi:MAG: protein kinase [Polyangiales bacterium]